MDFQSIPEQLEQASVRISRKAPLDREVDKDTQLLRATPFSAALVQLTRRACSSTTSKPSVSRFKLSKLDIEPNWNVTGRTSRNKLRKVTRDTRPSASS